MLTAFVLARHGYLERALILIESLMALGEDGEDVRMGRALLNFLEKDYVATLRELDHLDGQSGSQAGSRRREELVRARQYLRARCYCETGRRKEGEALARSLSAL